MRPIAYLVLGPESSGTKYLTRLLLRAGCAGDEGNRQRWDDSLEGAPRGPIVWRRSLPMGGAWPDLCDMHDRLAAAGYTVRVIAVLRNFFPCSRSQLRRGHAGGAGETAANINRAVREISSLGAARGAEVRWLTFETICHEPRMLCASLADWIEVEPSDARDENSKHLQEIVVSDRSVQNIYVYKEGGLGDVIIQYHRDADLPLLADYRARKRCYVKLVLNTHNPQAAELFRYDARFDEIQVLGYEPGGRVLHQLLADRGFVTLPEALQSRLYEPVKAASDFMLSAADLAYLHHVCPRVPFIVCQPGAGKPDYELWGRVDMKSLCQTLSARGLAMVLVGGTSRHDHLDGRMIVDRRSDFTHPLLYDLIDQANPRIVCGLIQRSAGFIGSLSCYVWEAIATGKRCTLYVPPDLNDGHVELARTMGAELRRFDHE